MSKMFYIRDFEVYALWKYLNGNLTARKVFRITDLTAPNTSALLVISFLIRCFGDFGITLEKPVFDKESYLKWQHKEYRSFQNDFKTKRFPAGKMIQKILENDFNIVEIKGCLFILKKYGLTDYIAFSKKIRVINQEKIKSFLDSYISAFVEDNLLSYDRVFIPFEKQKERLCQDIQDHRDKFGDSLILKHHPIGDELSPAESDPYLFIHTLVALEKTGSINVERTWVEDEVPPDLQTDDYKIKLEWRSLEKRESKANANKPEVVIEGRTAYFKFYKQGPKIKIGSIHTQGYRLLKCMHDPIGVKRTIESVFEKIATPKHMKDDAICDPLLRQKRQLEYIQFAVKGLQKIKGLTGRITLQTHDDGRQVSLKLG